MVKVATGLLVASEAVLANDSLGCGGSGVTAILGISAYYHDSAAALVVDGAIVAAAQEERFSRKKHDSGFPQQAIAYCLQEVGLTPGDLDYVGFYDKPLRTFERLLETYLAFAPSGFPSFLKALPIWLQQKIHLPREMNRGLQKAYRSRYVFTEHHQSHAASAFFPSPFEEAAILTFDGVGEWATASRGIGRGNRIQLTHQLRFPHSLGLLYAAFTYYTGFKVNSDEYKMMGLAPYGEPSYVDTILAHLIDLKEDGSFWMDMSYFNYCQGLTMTSRKFDELFGGPPRHPEESISQRAMDLAASVQIVTEEILLRSARRVHAETGMKNLCLAGGVALNCVGNGRLLREGPFENIWIQPAADDAGGALGVALFIWHQLLGMPREPEPRDSQKGSFLGPRFSDLQIREFLDDIDAHYQVIADEDELCDRVADLLANGKVVGWFQGRMEFGPRALGARSILGDARKAEMQSIINMKVKFREGFRPFAPAVLAEHAADYFEVDPACESPYMLVTAPVKADRRRLLSREDHDLEGIGKLRVNRSEIPAVTHVDFSARIQTVDRQRHGLYRKLLEAFHAKTGCPVVVNTSFNLGWDPIVCTPREAYETFMSSEIDALCMGHLLLEKTAQPAWTPAPVHKKDERLFDLLASPCCGSDLEVREQGLGCGGCGQGFPVEDGIPRLFWPHEGIEDPLDVTETVKQFYEEAPFPNYDEHESLRSLIEKSRRGIYGRKLDEAISHNSNVLEVGCGTGQLSNFLGVSFRRVMATDLCLNSLRLGEEFRRQHGLSRVLFVQMNLFRHCLKPESFDVILCNGVLHHTADPFRGFEGLVPLLKPGGYLVLGLYNRFGRLMTDLRRSVFRLTGGRARWLDPQLRSQPMSDEKQRAWFADQYRHPHESKHTIGEVLRWFERCDLQFVRGIPSTTPMNPPLSDQELFEPTPRGDALDHGLAQIKQIGSGSREGGFFLMIGRKEEAGARAASLV
jgi:carbamoyltransferase